MTNESTPFWYTAFHFSSLLFFYTFIKLSFNHIGHSFHWKLVECSSSLEYPISIDLSVIGILRWLLPPLHSDSRFECVWSFLMTDCSHFQLNFTFKNNVLRRSTPSSMSPRFIHHLPSKKVPSCCSFRAWNQSRRTLKMIIDKCIGIATLTIYA